MAREESCVLTNMCMVCDGEKILVQNRRNPNWPGITFPGGHVEPCESFVGSVVREVKEETGLDIADVRLCGIKQFTYLDGSRRYVVLLYRADHFSGELRASEEGEVFWIDRADLLSYPLADGFAEMYEVFIRDDLSENYHYFDGQAWQSENL